jgi:ribonuclease HI
LAYGDSKVVIEQVNKEWNCVKDTMDAYCTEIRKLEGHFEGIEFQHVTRNNNVAADVLSKLGSKQALVPARTQTVVQSYWIRTTQTKHSPTQLQHLPAMC